LYKVVWIRVTDDGRPEGLAAAEDFVARWFADSHAWGRLVGIALGLGRGALRVGRSDWLNLPDLPVKH
jgi:hypothetical protein